MPDNVRHQKIRLDESVYENAGTVVSITVCARDRRPLFADASAAEIVVDNLRALHGTTWRVLGYCVMPDHLHVLVVSQGGSVIDFVRLLKGRSAAGLRKLGMQRAWQVSFWDHVLRRNEDISEVLRYLLENPVRKGLVESWTDYPWCGSLQWPEMDGEFFARNPKDVLWVMALGGDE
jgi:REP element-mobilizing transposase RayT